MYSTIPYESRNGLSVIAEGVIEKRTYSWRSRGSSVGTRRVHAGNLGAMATSQFSNSLMTFSNENLTTLLRETCLLGIQ
jgi:hypothetical protein